MKTALESIMQAIITAGWNKISDGDVNAPIGHFAIVEIPQNNNELAEIVDAILDVTTGEEVVTLCTAPRGWYHVREDSDGIVYIDGPHTEITANRIYEAHQATYNEWHEANEEDI